ncbi:MAG: amidophosphoribosyltransferase [Lachnospiraceae bacterium]|jgi:amidophosphoribosyltransferase|nr:amidophosphoribosyltransferase [Lachnospiraceae bacterium]
MGGFFGVAAKDDCVFDLFFGTDYHSHLGTRRAGMAVYSPEKGYDRAIHNIESTPFRTKFADETARMEGTVGIGCISDYEPQPLIIRAHHGTYAIMTVGKINNADAIVAGIFQSGPSHFLELSGGQINATELVAALINQRDNIAEGIRHAQETIAGSMSIAVMTPAGIYAARDLKGRTPVSLGSKEGAYCLSFESFAYLNLGFVKERELGPGEIVYITPEGIETLSAPRPEMRICTFLWVYYGYPTASYENVGVEEMRYRCGKALALRDDVRADYVAGVPDSGIGHAIGYANASGIPLSRPLVKYTPTWTRSFLPTMQVQRDLIAKMKIIPARELIAGKKLLLIDDSIVRGTQLADTSRFLKEMGAKEIHVRPACPPLLYSCQYLNFSRSSTEMELITRRIVSEIAGEGKGGSASYVNHDAARGADLASYVNPDSEMYQTMVDRIGQRLQFDSLKYQRLDDMVAAVGLPEEKLCTYCWNGRE